MLSYRLEYPSDPEPFPGLAAWLTPQPPYATKWRIWNRWDTFFRPHTSAGSCSNRKGLPVLFKISHWIRTGQPNRRNLDGPIGGEVRATKTSNKMMFFARQFVSLAKKTRLPGIAIIPQKSSNRLKSIKLFRILEDKAMLVLVDECDHITDHLVCIPSDTTDWSFTDT